MIVILIIKFIVNILGYSNAFLYVANATELKLVDVNKTIAVGETIDLEYTDDLIFNIPIQPFRCLKFVTNNWAYKDNYIIACLETPDGQFDFTRFYLYNRDPKAPNYKWL